MSLAPLTDPAVLCVFVGCGLCLEVLLFLIALLRGAMRSLCRACSRPEIWDVLLEWWSADYLPVVWGWGWHRLVVGPQGKALWNDFSRKLYEWAICKMSGMLVALTKVTANQMGWGRDFRISALRFGLGCSHGETSLEVRAKTDRPNGTKRKL